MGKERRRDAIKVKLQRLEESIAKTKKDCEGESLNWLVDTLNHALINPLFWSTADEVGNTRTKNTKARGFHFCL